jgi:hypothetical protein
VLSSTGEALISTLRRRFLDADIAQVDGLSGFDGEFLAELRSTLIC